MKFLEAQAIAERVRAELSPHCVKCEIAGSVRRKKPEPGDIEIVAIPKPYNVGLFQSGIATVIEQWPMVKGVLPCKYTQRILPEGIKLDLFFATVDNWGLIFLIRTGSADFSKRFVMALPRRGLHAEGGYIRREDNTIVSTQTEEDAFQLAGMKWIPPEDRT